MHDNERDLTREKVLEHLHKQRKHLMESTLEHLEELEQAAKHARKNLPKWKPGDRAVFSTDDLFRIVGMISHARVCGRSSRLG